MPGILAWGILVLVFLLAGEGLNLFRIHIEDWLAFGHPMDIVYSFLGLIITLICTAFLGGFIYYRDKKRQKRRREGWKDNRRTGKKQAKES